MSEIIDIADAVVTTLNAHSFTQSFTAVRKYMPRRELADLSVLTVTVVPRRIDGEEFSRAGQQHDHGIDIAVQQKLDVDEDGEPDHTAADALVGLAEEIAAFCYGKAFDAGCCMSSDVDPIFSPEHMKEKHVFTAVARLTVKVVP